MRSLRLLSWYSLCALLLALLVMSSSGQQTTQSQSAQPPATTGSKKETVAKPMTDRQKKKQEEKLRKELETPYKKWLNEDVVYIITEDEKKTFTHLQTDEERESFIERNTIAESPTPMSISRRAFRAGKRIAGGFTSSTGRPTKWNRIPPAERTSGPLKKVAAPRPPILSSSGAIATSKAWAPTSFWNSSTPP
jgi:hypothetical protein